MTNEGDAFIVKHSGSRRVPVSGSRRSCPLALAVALAKPAGDCGRKSRLFFKHLNVFIVFKTTRESSELLC